MRRPPPLSKPITTPIPCPTLFRSREEIKISKDGSIKPTSGTAVTIDSDNKVVNDGTIQIGNANGATGIFAEAGVTGSITNSATGKIVIDESYEGEDIDKDGDKDGHYAVGNGRAGIKTGGAFTGNIVNAGPSTAQGNDSAGNQDRRRH